MKIQDVKKWDCKDGKAVAVNPSFDNIGKYPPLESDNKNWNEFNQWSSDPANQPTTELTGIYGSEQVEVVEQYRHGHCDWQNGSPEYQIPNVSYIFRYKLIEKPVVFNIETAVPEMISMVNKLSEMFPEPLPPVIGEESVEEAAHKLAKLSRCTAPDIVIASFKEGAQWQSTRMYTDKWIDVKDRLPKEYSDVIIFGKFTKDCPNTVYQATFNPKNKKFTSEGILSKNVTYWQPLPLPPNLTNVSPPTFTEQQVIELLEKMKEVAANQMDMTYHNGHSKCDLPLKYFQSGADNLQPNKESILSIDPKQFINEFKTKIRCKE